MMESLFFTLVEVGETLITAGWLPLLIWTFIGIVVWLILKAANNIHPEYQYHTRLGLIFSLPAGLIFLVLIEKISAYIVASTASETGLKIISVISPIDIAITPAEETAGVPLVSIFYATVIILFGGGLLFTLGRFTYQCIQLKRFRSRYSSQLQPVYSIPKLSPSNRHLALATQKQVRVAFLAEKIIPVTFGFRNPVILLPEFLKNEPGKFNLAIRHELTHIAQHDFFSHLLVLITESLFWFHPLVHRLKHELIEYREMRCDHLVLSEKSVSRKKYAMLLLELIPIPNINKELFVNMAQESSNLKKRITMITQQKPDQPIPTRSSIALLAAVFFSTAIVMACTDLQTSHGVFDEEELNLITDVDITGERGSHQIVIFMSEEEQAERHESKLVQLRMLQPDHIQSIEVLKDNAAVERFGSRGEKGVIVINTNLSEQSYNAALKALGMEAQQIPPSPPKEGPEGAFAEIPNSSPPPPPSEQDYFVVVEEMPELIGGLVQIQKEIRYPAMARRAGIEGRVYVQFVVTEQGNVENAHVIRGIGGGADEEALRVVSQAKFRPGYQRGRAVRVQYSLPIFFRLENSSQTES